MLQVMSEDPGIEDVSSCSRCRPKRPPPCRICGERDDCGGQRVRRSRLNENTVDAVSDMCRKPSDTRHDHRQAQRAGLHERHRQALEMRREGEDVECGHDPRRIGPIAQEREAIVEAKAGMFGSNLGLEGALTNGDEAHVRVAIEHDSRCGQEVRVALFGAKVRHRADEHGPRFEPQLGAHGIASGELGPHRFDVDAMDDGSESTARPRRNGLADLLGNGDVGIIEGVGGMVRKTGRPVVGAPHVVLGVDHADAGANSSAHDTGYGRNGG